MSKNSEMQTVLKGSLTVELRRSHAYLAQEDLWHTNSPIHFPGDVQLKGFGHEALLFTSGSKLTKMISTLELSI